LAGHPLVVDLDGTLIRTDLLYESVCKLFRESPASLCLIPYWLCLGKARLKEQLAMRTPMEPGTLPFNRDFVGWLQQERAHGRTLILCTASDQAAATAVAQHLGVFDEVMASNGTINLSGARKAEALVQRFGAAGFDYAGNSHADLAVWQRARRAVIVDPSADVVKQASRCGEVERVFPKPAAGFTAWRRVLRLHQWLKNLLLGVPVVAAHQVADLQIWLALMLAFASFSFCASAVYIVNDLLDLESDRQHPRKGDRPFASGLVPVWTGFLLAPLLLVASVVIARHVGTPFLIWLLVYIAVTGAYSFGLKRLLLIDCLTLAMLYTLRIIAGGAVAHIELSFWLLAFSCFLFLSLAFAKRYAELQLLSHNGKMQASGRAYYVSDAPLIQMLGITSGYAAVLVMALYLNSNTVLYLYRNPEVLWAAIPVTVFWVSWIWMQAHRGLLNEDAVVFALTDRVSLLAGLALACVLMAGAVSWPW
jgi:4-hydroxybenzoate polyprenyltransferase